MQGVVESLRAASRPLAAAAVLVVLEALTLLGLAVFLAVKGIVDEAKSLVGVVGGTGLALVGAVVLLGVTPWLLSGARWARSPVLVLQILWLPVGFSLAFQAGRPELGAPLLVVAAAVLVLLARAESRLSAGESVDDSTAAGGSSGPSPRVQGQAGR